MQSKGIIVDVGRHMSFIFNKGNWIWYLLWQHFSVSIVIELLRTSLPVSTIEVLSKYNKFWKKHSIYW